MNIEKVREAIRSHAEQKVKLNIEAALVTPMECEEQVRLSNDYMKSPNKEDFLKSKKGQRFVTLTCLIGNCEVREAIRCIREENGRFDPAYLGAYD